MSTRGIRNEEEEGAPLSVSLRRRRPPFFSQNSQNSRALAKLDSSSKTCLLVADRSIYTQITYITELRKTLVMEGEEDELNTSTETTSLPTGKRRRSARSPSTLKDIISSTGESDPEVNDFFESL
jgi:hypothetical protein